jgi:transcription elongation factor GreB
MSKAFTKEQEEPQEDELDDAPAVPSGKNYITPHGHNRLESELKRLLDEDRPEVVRIVSWAASNGDRSENGDYLYGKKKLREIDRRIRFLTKRLDSAVVVDPLKQQGKRALFGATLKVSDEAGLTKTYAIVGVDETDAAQGRVSWISPMGKALLQSQAGDLVTLRTPKGESELEVLEVSYVEIK